MAENKILWIIIISAYIGFSLIGLLLVMYSLNKFFDYSGMFGVTNQNVISKKTLIISILIILILVVAEIFVLKKDKINSNTDIGSDATLTGDNSNAIGLPITKRVKIGDYVEYMPDSFTYVANVDDTGHDRAQTLMTGDENWRVFYVDEDIGSVFITKETSMFDSDDVVLKGIKG